MSSTKLIIARRLATAVSGRSWTVWLVLLVGCIPSSADAGVAWQAPPSDPSSMNRAPELDATAPPSQALAAAESEMLRIRLQTIGYGCAFLFGLLVVAMGYFRLNHATRGIYSRRLLVFAILVSMLLVLALVVTIASLWQ